MSGFEPRPRGAETSGFRGAGYGLMAIGAFAVVGGVAVLAGGQSSCEATPTATPASTAYTTVRSVPSHSPEQPACAAQDGDPKGGAALMIVGAGFIGLGIYLKRGDERWERGFPARPKVAPEELPRLDDVELQRFMEAAAAGQDAIDQEFGPPKPDPRQPGQSE